MQHARQKWDTERILTPVATAQYCSLVHRVTLVQFSVFSMGTKCSGSFEITMLLEVWHEVNTISYCISETLETLHHTTLVQSVAINPLKPPERWHQGWQELGSFRVGCKQTWQNSLWCLCQVVLAVYCLVEAKSFRVLTEAWLKGASLCGVSRKMLMWCL